MMLVFLLGAFSKLLKILPFLFGVNFNNLQKRKRSSKEMSSCTAGLSLKSGHKISFRRLSQIPLRRLLDGFKTSYVLIFGFCLSKLIMNE